jgi:N-methylhydantoinase A
VYEQFEVAGRSELAGEGVPSDRVRLDRTLDLRYKGQSWKLAVPVPSGPLTADHLQQVKQAFDDLHEQAYGYSVPAEPAEIVNVGLSASGLIPRPHLEEPAEGGRSPAQALKGRRPVFFVEAGGYVETTIYGRPALLRGNVVTGPAVVEALDTSVVIHPDYAAEVGGHGVLLLRPVT